MLGVVEKATETITHTRDKILLASARLFAVRGYDAVSIRDIAGAVDVRASSIYAHYTGKEEILNALLERTTDLMDAYYGRLCEENDKAESTDAIMENLFFELKEVYTFFTYYGIAVAQSNMNWHQGAKKLYLESFLGNGREAVKRSLDRAVRKGFAVPFDTDIIAHLIMNTVSTCNHLRIAEAEGVQLGFVFLDCYTRMCDYLLASIKAGRIDRT